MSHIFACKAQKKKNVAQVELINWLCVLVDQRACFNLFHLMKFSTVTVAMLYIITYDGTELFSSFWEEEIVSRDRKCLHMTLFAKYRNNCWNKKSPIHSPDSTKIVLI